MRILFMGTPQFAVPSLKALSESFNVVGVITQPDKPAGRGKRLTPPPVKEVALEKGIEVLQPEKIKEFSGTIRTIAPDCIVVVAYGKILPKEVLEIPPKGVLNLHASLLPKYRGAAPIQRALMSGEDKTGNTIMLVNEEMDAGDIISQEEEPIFAEDNFHTLSERLADKGAKLLVKTLKEWLEGGAKSMPQNHEEATYAPPIEREEYRICWKAPAESVRDRVRALYPNAYTSFRGKRMKILHVEVVPFEGEPGEILEGDDFVVGCGRNAVVIRELVNPKGKRVKGKEFVRGYSPLKCELLK